MPAKKNNAESICRQVHNCFKKAIQKKGHLSLMSIIDSQFSSSRPFPIPLRQETELLEFEQLLVAVKARRRVVKGSAERLKKGRIKVRTKAQRDEHRVKVVRRILNAD